MTKITRELVSGLPLYSATIGNDDGGDNVFLWAQPATGQIHIQIEEAADRSAALPRETRALRAALPPSAGITRDTSTMLREVAAAAIALADAYDAERAKIGAT